MIFNITAGKKWVYSQITVTITGNSVAATYDADQHTASGYIVTIAGDPNYTEDDFTFSGTASASGTNVGTYSMGLNASQFVNINPMYQNVQFVVNDGSVVIGRKSVTCTAADKTKIYGASDPALTATVVGTIGSDTITYSLSRQAGNNVGTYTITPTGDAQQGNYEVTYNTGTLTINKAAASGLGLSVTAYNSLYNGSAHTVTASVSVSSGTTIQYSTDNTNWSTTNPSRTNVGITTVYVRAVNSNYETATATSSVTLKCRMTVNTAASASVKFGSTTVTANSSGVATYDTSSTGSVSITATKNSLSASGSLSVTATSGTLSLDLPIRTQLFVEGQGAQVTITPHRSTYRTAAGWGADAAGTASVTNARIAIAGDSWIISESESGNCYGYVETGAINLSNYSKIVVEATAGTSGFLVRYGSTSAGTFTRATSRTVKTFSIASVTGSYALSLYCGSSSYNGYIYNWYLEV